MFVKLSHSQNAPLPILVTLLGISMDVRFEQRENAFFPTLVTGQLSKVDGMVISPLALVAHLVIIASPSDIVYP